MVGGVGARWEGGESGGNTMACSLYRVTRDLVVRPVRISIKVLMTETVQMLISAIMKERMLRCGMAPAQMHDYTAVFFYRGHRPKEAY